MPTSPFFHDLTQDLHSHPLLAALLLPLVCLIFALIARKALLIAIDRWVKQKHLLPASFDLKQHFWPFVLLTLFIVPMRGLSFLLPLTAAASKTFQLTLQVVLVFSITWFLIKTMDLVREILFHKIRIDTPNNLRRRKARTQIQYLARIVNVALMFLGFCAILMSFDGARRFGTSLATSAGLAGLVIGFAAQRTLANVIAGFSIAFTQPIRIDDVVVVEGEWGRIEEITLTYVVVRLWDRRALVLPITYFVEKPFQNWTRQSSHILGTAFFYLDYDAPIEAMRAKLCQILAGSPLWDGDVGVVQVTDATEKSLQVRILVSARDSGAAFDLRCLVREEMIAFLRREYPQSLPRIRLDGAHQVDANRVSKVSVGAPDSIAPS